MQLSSLLRANKRESGGGGGGTLTDANNGLSLNGTIATFGQDVGAVGNPGALLSNREVPAANFTISFKADAAQTNNIIEFKNTAAAIRARITKNAEFSNTGGQTLSEVYGTDATVTGINAIAVGNNSLANEQDAVFGRFARNQGTGTSKVLLGKSTLSLGSNPGEVIVGNDAQSNSATGGSNVIIGTQANTNNVGVVIVGYGASAKGYSSMCFGNQANVLATHDYSIAMGAFALTTAAHQLVVGSNGLGGNTGIQDFYFGQGVQENGASLAAINFNCTGASGNNTAGVAFNINGSKATGNAAGGSLLFKVSTAGASGTTLQALNTWGKIEPRIVTFGDIDAIGNSVRLVINDSTTSIKTNGYAQLIGTTTAFNNGAGAGAGTLTNAPAAGNPTKWIPIDDNGTTRHIPAW